ncbi:MAG: hypothetical protein GY860_16230 [Desulfobacteraceae bacterium]|nr:hypothetical protein [Desulfobacteraceae bacterium]
MITETKAIKIANKEVESFGYNLKLMAVSTSYHEEPWNDYFPKENTSNYYSEKRNQLKNKKYWAVYYFKKKIDNIVVKGGDVCIFVDSATGKVLTNYRGK